MATPYNLNAGLYRAREASRPVLADPGLDGTIIVAVQDRAVATLETASSTYLLQDATTVPLGVKVVVVMQAAGSTVNGVAIGDGEYAEFLVSLTSAGVHEWVVVTSSVLAAAAGVIPASAGTYEFLATETAADAVDGLLTIITALDAAGLIDGSGITQAI